MRVGVYIDGYNLYYGARTMCGRGTAGWRWLNLRALAGDLLEKHKGLWPAAEVARVVYCTARISGAENHEGQQEQDVYLRALRVSGSVDELSLGTYRHPHRDGSAGRGGEAEQADPDPPTMAGDDSGQWWRPRS